MPSCTVTVKLFFASTFRCRAVAGGISAMFYVETINKNAIELEEVFCYCRCYYNNSKKIKHFNLTQAPVRQVQVSHLIPKSAV